MTPRAVVGSPTRPELGDELGRIRDSLDRPELNDLVLDCQDWHPDARLEPTRLLELFRRSLQRERESRQSPGWKFLHDVLTPAAAGPGADSTKLLRTAVRIYLERTAYLSPILTAFTCDLHRLATSFGGQGVEIYLLLRDALAFWPGLIGAGRVHFLVYSRDHQDAGVRPGVVLDHGNGDYRFNSMADLSGALLVDAGLWGSLIRQLLVDGYWRDDTSVLFLGSRNPMIEGWANTRLTSHLYDGEDEPSDPFDVVRLVDSVESLLKPFVFLRRKHSCPPRIRLTDPISFACASAFLWALHQHLPPAQARPEWSSSFRAIRRDPTNPAWIIRRAAPNSQDGRQLLAGWSYGPLPPRDALCGFPLGNGGDQ